MGVSTGFGVRRGDRPGQLGGERGKQGDGQLRGALRCRRRAPACLPGEPSSSLERWLGWAGRWASGWRQVSLSLLFCFCFYSVSLLNY